MHRDLLIKDSSIPNQPVAIKLFDIKCRPTSKKDSTKGLNRGQFEGRKAQRVLSSAVQSTHFNILLRLSKDADPLFHRNTSQSFSPSRNIHPSTASLHSSQLRSPPKSTKSNFSHDDCKSNNYKNFPTRKVLRNKSPYKLYMFSEEKWEKLDPPITQENYDNENDKQLRQEFKKQMRHKAHSVHSYNPVLIPLRRNLSVKEVKIEPWSLKQENDKFQHGF